jgi:hypothetical protein
MASSSAAAESSSNGGDDLLTGDLGKNDYDWYDQENGASS